MSQVARVLILAGADPLATDRLGEIPKQVDLTRQIARNPRTAAAVIQQLQAFALCHLADQPAAAGELLTIIAERAQATTPCPRVNWQRSGWG